MKKNLIVYILAALLLLVAGCSGGTQATQPPVPAPSSVSIPSPEPTASQPPVPVPSVPPQTQVPGEEEAPQGYTATVYIGMDGEFTEYPNTFDHPPTPEDLVADIAGRTGWDLTLADVITTGKGGMTVSFAPQSALFTGPPEEQKEAFHVYDATQLCRTILDSVQATLQHWAVVPGLGDPASVDIYYCDETGGPLELPGIDLTIPMDQPYSAGVWA